MEMNEKPEERESIDFNWVTERTWVGGTGHGPSLEEKEWGRNSKIKWV